MRDRSEPPSRVGNDRLLIVVSILLSGAAAAASGASPLGVGVADQLLTSSFAMAVAALIVRTRTAFMIPLIGLGLLAGDWTGRLFEVIAIVAFIAIVGNGKTIELPARAVAAPCLANVLFYIDDFGHDRLSAYAAALVIAPLGFQAIRQLSGRSRRRLAVASVAVGAIGIGLSLALVVKLDRLATELRRVESQSQEAAALLADGEFSEASLLLDNTRAELVNSRADLRSGTSEAARWIPGLSQNLRALDASTEATIDLIDATTPLTGLEQLPALFGDGRLKADWTSDVGSRLDEALAASPDPQQLTELDSVWLAPELEAGTSQLVSSIVEFRHGLRTARDAVEDFPALTGYGSPRNYLVLIGNPAEARDLGGFAAGFAVVRLSEGRIQPLLAGRPGDLEAGHLGDLALTELDVPRRYLEMEPWKYGQNLTAVADLPTLARSLNIVRPEVFGSSIDGVIYLDPYGLELLVGLTEPVTIDDYDLTLDGTNVASFFVTDQYELFPSKPDRNQILRLFIEQFSARLGRGNFSTSGQTLPKLVSAVGQGRLAMAVIDADEHKSLAALGADGGIEPMADDVDYLAVRHLNGGPNKLDAYLQRTIDYTAEVDDRTGALEAVASVTLANTATADLQTYVAGNSHGYPNGSNRVVVSVNTAHDLVGWTGPDDEPAMTRSFREFGRWRHERVVIVAPSSSVTVAAKLEGHIAGDGYELFVENQPLVNSDELEVAVRRGPLLLNFETDAATDQTFRAK